MSSIASAIFWNYTNILKCDDEIKKYGIQVLKKANKNYLSNWESYELKVIRRLLEQTKPQLNPFQDSDIFLE